MQFTDLVQSPKFLVAGDISGSVDVEVTASLFEAYFLHCGQETVDTFDALLPNGQSIRLNLNDWIDALIEISADQLDSGGTKWYEWCKQCEQKLGHYLEQVSPDLFQIVESRISLFEDTSDPSPEAFVENLVADLERMIRCLLFHEHFALEVPKPLLDLWGFWCDGYWPCGIRGSWPTNFRYVLFRAG